jgi:hypothetical protein
MCLQKEICKKTKKNLFFVGILKATDEKRGSREEGTDPQIRIPTKMSRIHNTTEKNIILGCYPLPCSKLFFSLE